MENECLRSMVVSECRSMELVPESTVVDENRATNKCCCQSMRSMLFLRIERSKLAGSGENSSLVSLLLVVLLGMYLKIQENILCRESVLNLTKIKSNRRSKLPDNGTKFDITQITIKSEFTLSNKRLRGSIVVLWD